MAAPRVTNIADPPPQSGAGRPTASITQPRALELSDVLQMLGPPGHQVLGPLTSPSVQRRSLEKPGGGLQSHRRGQAPLLAGLTLHPEVLHPHHTLVVESGHEGPVGAAAPPT